MAKLVLLRGISGSGKSSWAQQYIEDNANWAIVSRDLIRKTGVTDENLVTKIQDSTIENMLSLDCNVIVDDTNVVQRYVNRLAKIGYANNAEVIIMPFEIDVEDAIARVQARAAAGGHFVPEDVIRSQYKRIQKQVALPNKFNPAPIVRDRSKPSAFMVDIDGTLAHMCGKRGPYDWNKVRLDEVDEELRDLLNDVFAGGKDKIILMSGRDSVCRPDTEKWLDEAAHLNYNELFMRAEGDLRPDEEVKYELFMKHVYPNYDVKIVFDDRQKVVNMWRKIGLKTYQVAPGDF